MTVFTWEMILQIAAGDIPMPKLFSNGSALSIGSFDGPHIGHEKLFQEILQQKEKNGCSAGVISFRRPLGGYKKPAEYKGDVSTLAQRLKAFETAGLDFAIVIDFSDDFCKMEGRIFLSLLKKCCNMIFLAEGRDFHCGHFGATGIAQICAYAAEQDFNVAVVPPVLYGQERVSSTRIRQDILNGDFRPVQFMLSHPYQIDCCGFRWSLEKKENTVCLTAVKNLLQVLPTGGIFDVMVILSDGTDKNSCKAKLIVEPQFLRLQVPRFDESCTVRAIEFISAKII